jgi:hypothetical protein
MRHLLLAVALLWSSDPASARSAANFVERWSVVSHIPRGSPPSPELAQLMNEVAGAVRAYRAQVSAALAAGQRPRSCLPPRASLNSGALVAAIQRLPASEQARPFEEVLGSIFDHWYACPGNSATRANRTIT